MREKFNTFYADPGEDFGWCIANGTELLSAGTEKMWTVADALYDKVMRSDHKGYLSDPSNARTNADVKLLRLPVGRVVCEDWRLYPNKLKHLKWDRCRTARVIGDLAGSCRRAGVPMIYQPASIKSAAQSAGAEELYYHPLRPNRHQNDAIQHFVFYINTVLLSEMDEEERYAALGIPNNAQEGGDDD